MADRGTVSHGHTRARGATAAAAVAVPGHPVPAEPLSALITAGAGVGDDEVHQRRGSRHTADLATIIYTSGTTGRPKGCELTHGNLLADVRNVMHGWLPAIFETPGASTLLFLPLAHSFARIIQVGCLESGVVLGHTPSVASLLPTWPRSGPRSSWPCRGSSRRSTTAWSNRRRPAR